MENNTFCKRVEASIQNYITGSVEIADGVRFSQHQLIQRIYKFRNRDLSGSKINEDLSYNYYYDIISPRADAEVKNLRFDTKHILLFSRNPIKDFPAVFVANAALKSWMADNGEDEKLKEAVEEFSTNGNIGFKKVKGGYDIIDPLNTYITNTTAKTVNDTDIIERYELSASQILAMNSWNASAKADIIKELGNKSFKSTENATPTASESKVYELFEFTGEMNEKEYNELSGEAGGDENKYFLAKVILAGLRQDGSGKKYIPFIQKLDGLMTDYYIYAHRGKYEGRFWRIGMYELLFDHQIRANEIGNQLSRGLDWASKVIFKSSNSRIMQNLRADLENGDVIITDDLSQIDVRMQGMDQLIADWNRLMADADRLSNSFEIVRGEQLPSGTPFRLGALLDQNAGMFFVLLRQKITLPYKRVFRNWVLPTLVNDLKATDIFTLVGETDILDQLREIIANQWYMDNLIYIGPHTKEVAEAIKQEKVEELNKFDPTIENSSEIWKGVLPRIFVTITGENSDIADQISDLINLIGLEDDPIRKAWILDQIYRVRGIPVPPKTEPAEQMMPNGVNSILPQGNNVNSQVNRQQPPLQ